MGSCITHMFDNYDTYVAFCKVVGDKPITVSEDFYSHEKELLKKHGYEKDGCWYKRCD